MADPGMMSLFGEDGNLFSEGLEGLGECGYPENPVNSMAQQMPMDQGFGALQSPLHHSTSNQNQSKLTHFDHYNQYEPQKMHMIDQPNRMMANTSGNGIASPHSQYHNTPVPQVPHGGGQMGVYPGMQNDRHGPSFVDNGSMWGPRAVQVPEQIRPSYQQQSQQQPPAPSGPQGSPHHQHVQQMGNYMVRGDFSMQQHGPLQSQRMNQFSQGQEGLNQGNPFLGAAGPGHLSHVPQQNPNMGSSLRHTVQQFHHHSPTTHHGESVAHSPRFSPNPSQQSSVRPQSLNFNSRNQTVPSPTLNNSGQYSRYPYSNLNQGLVNNTGMNQNLGLTNNTPMTPSVPRYPNTVGFPSNNSQGLMHQQPIHPSGSLNQMNPQTMHPSQPQGTYASPPPMSPLKAMSNPAGTPPPQVRPGSAGIPMDVGSYPNMPHPPPTHQPPGSMAMGQRNIGPRNIQQSQAFMGMSSAPREMGGHMRPNGCPGVSHADPQAIQERMMSGQQHPGHQSFQQQMANCQPHPAMHHQSSPPSHSHHQPWTSLHQSPQNTPQKVPVHQHSPSESFLDNSIPDMTRISGPNASLISTEDFLPSMQSQTPQKKRKKKNNHIATDKTVEGFGLEGFPGENPDLLIEGAPDGKKKKKPKVKKEPKEPKEPKQPKEPKAKKEPKEPKAPKPPKLPKEPKEKKVKSTTPKPKANKKTSNKSDAEGSAQKKKVNKVKPEGVEPSDLDKTPTPSSSPPPAPPPPPEEEDDSGVQKRRSSRQVKRKRYTEDLEFKISDEELDDADGRDSPSEQQDGLDAEGPVVEKIMSCRLTNKQQESGEEVATEEFYVKYKNYSYLHCHWATVEELEKDKRIQQKIKRFRAKQGQNKFLSEIEDDLFNPDYVEVDRILDVAPSTDENGEPVCHYLVKWCSLPYEDSTWELKQDLDQAKIEEFEKLQSREPETERVQRPPADDWKKSESSREYKNNNSLREYQLEGVNWLLFNWYNKRNCILADEMGLGKTIQSITFLYEIFLKGIHGPYLVIAPLSTIPNWEREFHTWTELNVVVYHGSQASRKTIQHYEMYFKDPQGKIIKGAYKFHAIITTFEMILTDCPELRNINWRCVVIDEAHRLKNRNCKLLEGLKMMDLEHKVLLTGTPLQNTVEELFSLLNFLEPDRFPSESNFMQEFGDLKTEEQVQKLQGILKPMMLRRLKEDVEKNLAPKEETIIEVELTNVQKKYYRAILEKNFAFLSKGGGGSHANVPNLLNTMMELRKCCNHPYLIKGAEEKILEEFRETHNCDPSDFQLQAMTQAAGKLVLIDKLLPKLKAGGHRVLIFSQMVRCLDILEDYLIQRRYPYERIDGRVRGNLRQAAIDRFSKPDSDRFVFLLCTRAGGLGINLTAADTCIIFDSDWNPQNDLQAQARCHRIGQSKSVKIYRLITRNSYEREMFDKASLKLGLDKAVLQSMSGRENATNGVQQLSKKEIEDLLRKGAYGALMEEEDEGSKFCEEDIDQILSRRTHTITIESEGKGSTFAKASFVASGNRTDISLDDPNFWQKWAKKAELDLEVLNGRNTLVIDTPRVRKQTRLFSAVKEDELMEFSDMESDSEDRPTIRPRRPQDKSQGYARSECFRVEKNLLVYGWGRWTDILSHGRFKRQLSEQDVETICRTILVYCLNHYRGDENIKGFVWDLITPTEDGQTRALVNHSGLSAPVPRGRKGKKVKSQNSQPVLKHADWLQSCNPDALFQEDSYKKHLKHHCNKVLLRVRMLYYLRQEVIGDQADRILEGADSSEVDVWIPEPFHAEVPTDWWDNEADKSLLIGVFKHGYEKYNSIRADPALCFLERAGMPDAKAIAAEQRGTDMLADGGDGGDFDREDEDPEYKPARLPFKDDIDEFANSPMEDKEECLEMNPTGKSGEGSTELGHLYWPNTSALTTRLRRLITAYQRSYKRQQMRQDAQMKIDRRRRRPREEVRALEAEREAIITEKRQKWTRREEADFYRVVSTFGVIFDHAKQKLDWNQFRAYARLDKKSDESLEKYFSCFVAMCRRVCHMGTKPEEDICDLSMMIEPITEERASRTLYRIELLRKIREQVLNHPQLNERLKLCQPSIDLPEWWDCGKHDRDLLVGAAKHGVSRTDYHILNDPEFSFLEAHRSFAQNRGSSQPSNLPILIPPEPGYSDTPPIMPSTPNPDVKGSGNEEVKTEEVKTEDVKTEEVKTEKGEDLAIKEESGIKEEQAADTAEKSIIQESDPEAVTIKEEMKMAEETPVGPKSISEKGSEEDDEKLDYDDKSEESSQAEVGISSQDKNFDEESNASLSTARDETRDGFFLEDGDQSGLHMLRERTFSFSFWPKDRVIINRLDNICEAVLKGKWPVNRRQMFDFPGLLPGYTPTAVDSPLQKRSFAELSMVAQGNYSGSEDISASPQLSQETSLSLSVPRQRRRRRRKIEVEAERAAKRRNLMEMVAQLRGSQMGAENGQEKVVDLSNASREVTSSTSSFPSLTSQFLLNNSSTPVSDAFKTQMERLQAGLSCTPTRHLLNGSLIDGEPPMKRRRGRRKNVEGLDLLFMSNKRTSSSVDETDVTKAYDEDIETPPTRNIPSPGQLEPETRIPVINLEDGARLAGEEAPKNKDLVEWLKLHPTYTVDMPSYVPKTADMLFSHFEKPKQKRHRCRNPNKLDINTLTGDERVPVVNKRNGKKMGGAMAPPMRDLPRWLEENPEFAVAPDWTDIVKQSGFVPDSMFDRLLTGPVIREEGASRRGRRPKSEIAKAAAAAAAVASTSGINPLLMNSLFAGMDLASLQNLQNLQSLQLAGLMGFPHGLAAAAAAGGDSKNAAAMLPLMLPGMAGLPNMFGLGGLLNNPLAAGSSNSTTASSQGETEDGTSKADEKKTETEEDAKDSEKTDTVSATEAGSVGAATTTAGLSANALAFSPFLLSTMAPGLFYPSMFLPPGLGGLTLPGFPSLAGLQSAVSSSEEKAADDCENQEPSDAEESMDKTADSSILEDETAQGEEGESPDGEDELDNETDK